ncbi:MAG: FmdB family zinc ribbon protein [Anaerolineae bacterium]
MPTYVYQCETCGQFEQWQSFKDSPLAVCPTCGSPVRRVITPAPIVFKGSGWYSTDSRSSQSKAITGGSAGNGKKEDKADAPSTTAESKPASSAPADDAKAS